MLPWVASETVVRLRGASSDNGYGDKSTSWTDPERLSIDGCSVQFAATTETSDGRTTTTVTGTWYGPYDADVTEVDRIEHDGQVYAVDGEVVRQSDPTGFGLDHSWALIRKVRG